jgi:hypothetical protein
MARKLFSTELKQILATIPKDKQPVASRLAAELDFMHDTLEDLKLQIREGGTMEHFSQGKQNFLRESPALKSYNTTIQRYSALYKQLTDLMPKEQEAEKPNAVYDFVKGVDDFIAKPL